MPMCAAVQLELCNLDFDLWPFERKIGSTLDRPTPALVKIHTNFFPLFQLRSPCDEEGDGRAGRLIADYYGQPHI